MLTGTVYVSYGLWTVDFCVILPVAVTQKLLTVNNIFCRFSASPRVCVALLKASHHGSRNH